MRLWTATVLGLLVASPALGCPFCETGGRDAALFIVTVLVPFTIAGFFILFAARRLAKDKPAKDASQRLFEAEGRMPLGESHD